MEALGRVLGLFLLAAGFLTWASAYGEQVANANCGRGCPVYSDVAVLGTIEGALVTIALGILLLTLVAVAGTLRLLLSPHARPEPPPPGGAAPGRVPPV